MLENLSLLSGITQKMGFLQARQRVLAQNITNSNTPGYQANDVKSPDFSKTLAAFDGGVKPVKTDHLQMTETASQHIAAQTMSRPLTIKPSKQTYDITPTGNSISMEEQMMASSQTAGEYQLMTNLYNKNLAILRAAIRG